MPNTGRNQYDTPDSPWRDADTLESLYHGEGLSMRDVADRLGCSEKTVMNWMNRYDIGRRKPLAERPPCYTQTEGGYQLWRTLVDGEQLSVYVHRLLAVAEWGFGEVVGQEVHHKNGIPWDNRHENIEVIGSSEHMRMHAMERIDEIREQAKNQERASGGAGGHFV